LEVLERLGKEVENAVAMVPDTRSAVSERPLGGSYLNIEVDRDAAARYGVNIRDANMVIASAIGGCSDPPGPDRHHRSGQRPYVHQNGGSLPHRMGVRGRGVF